jgi:8-oxo-dGTP pyrophosphatase MutT (NUDIX family)
MKTVAKILIFDAENNALVLRRSETHPNYPHEADLPGGYVEDGEDEETAVQREVAEEAGLDIPVDDMVFARRIIHEQNDVLYVARIDAVKPEVKISREHESYEWVPSSSLREALDTKDNYMDVAREYISSPE